MITFLHLVYPTQVHGPVHVQIQNVCVVRINPGSRLETILDPTQWALHNPKSATVLETGTLLLHQKWPFYEMFHVLYPKSCVSSLHLTLPFTIWIHKALYNLNLTTQPRYGFRFRNKSRGSVPRSN